MPATDYAALRISTKIGATSVAANGTLYGTTEQGYLAGTLFSISTIGNERVLYKFGSIGDGDSPEAGLLALNGTLYGTTSAAEQHRILHA